MVKVTKIKSKKEAEVYCYETKTKGALWGFRHKYYNALGERKEKKGSGYSTEKAAIKALLQVKAELLSGGSKKVEYENMTVGQWLDIWYESNKKKWKDGTAIQREWIIRTQLKPFLGRFKLQKLDKMTYEREFIHKVEGHFKFGTIRLWHTIFKIAINAAVENEILDRNRFTKVAILNDKEADVKNNFLTPAELNILLNDVKQNENITNYSLILTLAYTGIRRGEALGLQWQNIDFKKHTITVERTRDDKGTRTPKTKNSYRTIVVDEIVMVQLENYKKWCKKELLKVGKKLTGESFIFISSDIPEPIKEHIPIHIIRKSIKRTGIHKINVHGLRHTHATILLNNDFNVKAIADRLGNTVQMIYNVYGHVMKKTEKESVLVFNQALNGAKTGAK
ncbi:site-specific integrase [Rummeliibacillus sp. POC4]|uniref:tyrosine-type recombinase/integrase n=1 Tax=Rummeliibacillus sp. POC4 TaxID=2305899 RepID=UPI000E66BFA6|nr:site-specific integrase [Rummeliibacillus sp. POC4]RIJ64164.1 site-specific integrase [Rummeliibacillus sp. POC4]